MSSEASVGAAVRAYRQQMGMSLREASEASGVAFSTIGRVENGSEPTPSVHRRLSAWMNGETPLLPAPPMTLRDWFAGQALAGLAGMSDNTGMAAWLVDDAAQRAYDLADAMLAERERAK